MMSKNALLSMVSTNRAVDAGRRNKPPSFGGRGQPSFSVGDRDEATPVGDPMRYGSNARHSGGHRSDLGRPTAAIQTAGLATVLRL